MERCHVDFWKNSMFVGIGWCMFEIECVIAWYTMHHDIIAIAHSTRLLFTYNGNITRPCADVDVD